MTKEYHIKGMTCVGCVTKVKKALESVSGVASASVQLTAPQGTISFEQPLDVQILQNAIGHYNIQEVAPKVEGSQPTTALPDKSLSTYRPLLLIVAFLIGVSLLAQYPFTQFSGMLWMRHFMAGFFLTFSFFKLLNIEGFANSFRMYDIVAERWPLWGYVYPFLELILGILYLINIAPIETNIATIVLLGVGSIGVIKSNWDQRAIKCACLGDVFNLPMSTVTIVENVSMLLMAFWMLLL